MTGALTRLKHRAPRGDERGAISLFVAVAAASLILIVGLVVDGGGKLRALNHAEASAQEAARTGAQAVNAGMAISGGGIRLDKNAAQAAASKYLSQAGVSGTVGWADDRTIVVSVTEHYSPVFLPGSWSVTGHGQAKLIVQGG